MTDAAPHTRRATAQTVVSLAAQGALVLLGLGVVLVDDAPESNITLLAVWCLSASVFTIVALVLLGHEAHRPEEGEMPPPLQISRLARILTILGTVLPSLIGLAAAAQVIFSRGDKEWGPVYAVVGVWAMLVSWGLLHWGYSQIYLQRYFRSVLSGAGPTMVFPRTEHPRTVDFVYFSFTVGTSFATSDVSLVTSAGRWLATWHSVVAFFFNGLIIVFALSTMLGR